MAQANRKKNSITCSKKRRCNWHDLSMVMYYGSATVTGAGMGARRNVNATTKWETGSGSTGDSDGGKNNWAGVARGWVWRLPGKKNMLQRAFEIPFSGDATWKS